jgi:hypothetical protein
MSFLHSFFLAVSLSCSNKVHKVYINVFTDCSWHLFGGEVLSLGNRKKKGLRLLERISGKKIPQIRHISRKKGLKLKLLD